MSSTLPEELLKEVFALILLVPDHLFHDTSSSSPFARVKASTSSLLLVCKRWLRISTPTLYETLILRSKAQIISFSNAVAADTRLALHVRRVRLEGAVPDVFGNAAKRMVLVKEICVALSSYESRRNGLLQLLRAVRPRKVAFAPMQFLASSTVKSLEKAMATQPNLEVLILPQQNGHYGEFRTVENLITAASSTSTLRQVTIPVASTSSLQTVLVQPITIGLLERQPPIKLIILVPDVHLIRKNLFEKFALDKHRFLFFQDSRRPAEAARPVTELWKEEEAVTVLWRNPLDFAPPEVQSEVWKIIVREAVTLVEGCLAPVFPISAWFNISGIDRLTAASLLYTNRSLSNHVLSILAERLRFVNEFTVRRAEDVLQAWPWLGSNIQYVSFQESVRPPISIISMATQLRFLRASFSTESELQQAQDFFTAIMDRKSNIRDLSDEVDGSSVLEGCEKVAMLRWSIPLVPFAKTADRDALANLQHLSTSKHCVALLRWLYDCNLSRLTTFSLGSPIHNAKNAGSDEQRKAEMSTLTLFLEAHGPKILRLVCDEDMTEDQLLLCSNLVTLELDSSVEPESTLCVEWSSYTSITYMWGKLLEGLYLGAYPTLDEVVAKHHPFWPTSEYALSSTPWQATASERLKERGVVLKDASGAVWRPRLEMNSVLRRSGRVSGRRK
ncbi:hypothetical protein BKA62DRAFT_682892 [Auriculariales sp. MPI-PUGE-AT-0066]|nr:hypothetical protein BKA62DRAFT_682892 [Auriculariales sp. MPI-PUGE-AT-0066]